MLSRIYYIIEKILETKRVLYLLCGAPRPAWLTAEGNQPAACLARVEVRGDAPARARIEGERQEAHPVAGGVSVRLSTG